MDFVFIMGTWVVVWTSGVTREEVKVNRERRRGYLSGEMTLTISRKGT